MPNQPQHPKEYLNFLRAWLDFAEDHSNNPHRFKKHYGLCTNVILFEASTEYRPFGHLEVYLTSRLQAKYIEAIAPFNNGDSNPLYQNELDKTKNSERLAFVQKELENVTS